jgi:ABC-type lipopolysaccharide export system ATPase subunit
MIQAPRLEQKIGKMPDIKTLHIDLLQAIPTSGRLITDVLIDRNPTRVAALLGYNGAGPLGQSARALGVVKGDAGNYGTNEFNADLFRKMPYRIKGNT